MRSVRLFSFLPGYVAYDAALRWQIATAAAVRAGLTPETLAVLEHEPVFSFGRRPRYDHLLLDARDLEARGARIVESDRGGDVTFHGPGQLVAYPILDLKRRHLGPKDYVCALEETVIRALAIFGIDAERVAGRPGVWVDGAKIAAVGVRIQDGVSTHGLAFNVETDLSWFDAIVPCGLTGVKVTSVQEALSSSPSMAAARHAFLEAFAAVFDSRIEPVAAPALRELVPSRG